MSSAQEQYITRWLKEESDEEVIGGEVDENEGDQNIASNSEEDVPLSHMQISECYVVKRKLRNGRTEIVYRWKKQPPSRTCRTRSQNIVTRLPGPKTIC
ncbi:hypothetical protein EVAR_88055_1 [Eumeta japonica]|uniref:Uncharacterized protein n=1 Tax=Eumeta variegata TaxID=151549 RepID=A0A4C1WGD4_EUMVA|nr:hypothetical protein EVAR_88055_1 [Eumeta japonica]